MRAKYDQNRGRIRNEEEYMEEKEITEYQTREEKHKEVRKKLNKKGMLMRKCFSIGVNNISIIIDSFCNSF